MKIEITRVTFDPRPIARLVQDFSGAYHVKVGSKIEAFSVSLAQAQAIAEKNGWQLR